jgi:hypothetical protein
MTSLVIPLFAEDVMEDSDKRRDHGRWDHECGAGIGDGTEITRG